MACYVISHHVFVASLASFYEIERVPPTAVEKLSIMGVMELDDLHYVTCDHYMRAGVPEIASIK